jgi:hypothetical protein
METPNNSTSMKHYVLVTITRPQRTDSEGVQKYFVFRQMTQADNQSEKLAENIWLIERASGAKVLAEVLSAAAQTNVKFDIRYFTEEI